MSDVLLVSPVAPSGPRGFTLVEVVIALLVLELAVVGAVGILVIASATLTRAERLERIAALAEGVLDSLEAAPLVADGSRASADVVVDWIVGADGQVAMNAFGPTGDTLLKLESALLPRVAGP